MSDEKLASRGSAVKTKMISHACLNINDVTKLRQPNICLKVNAKLERNVSSKLIRIHKWLQDTKAWQALKAVDC